MLFFTAIALMIASGCSTLEPSYKITPGVPSTYDKEKAAAEGVIRTFQEKSGDIAKESTVYTVASVLAGLGAAVTGIYEGSDDLIKGFVFGGATVAGLNAYLNPGDIVKFYDQGAESINCAINVTDKIDEQARLANSFLSLAFGTTASFAAGLGAVQQPLTQRAATITGLMASQNLVVSVAAGSVDVALANVMAADEIYYNALDQLSQGQSPNVLLHDAVIEIVIAMNKAIRNRDRNLNALDPKKLIAAVKSGNKVIEDAVKEMNTAVAVAESQTGPQAALVGATNNNTLRANMMQNIAAIAGIRKKVRLLENQALEDNPFAACMPQG